MKKTEVYSWRVATQTKMALEEEARREGSSVASLLDRITREWMEARRSAIGDEADQARWARIVPTLGTISGGGPSATNEHVRRVIRNRLAKRYGRPRLD